MGIKSLFLTLGGCCLIGTGVWFAAEATSFVDDARHSEGVVVRVVAERGARGSKLYHPVVQFRPANQTETIEFTADPGLWPGLHEAGDSVTVAYRLEEPMDARVESFWMLWFLPLICGLFGFLCLVAGWKTREK